MKFGAKLLLVGTIWLTNESLSPWWPWLVQIEISLDGAHCHNKKNPREGDAFAVLTIFMAIMFWNVWNLINVLMIRFISWKNFTKTLNLYQLSLPQISLSMEFGAKPLLVNQIVWTNESVAPNFIVERNWDFKNRFRKCPPKLLKIEQNSTKMYSEASWLMCEG